MCSFLNEFSWIHHFSSFKTAMQLLVDSPFLVSFSWKWQTSFVKRFLIFKDMPAMVKSTILLCLIILTITFTHAHLWYIFKYLCVCVHHCMIYIFFNILSCSIKPETCPRTNSCFPICLSRYSGDSRGVTEMYLYAHHLSALPLPGVLLHLRTSCISVCLAWGSQTALFRSLRSHQSVVSLQLGTQATSMPALSVLLTMWSVFLQTPGY